jgi:phage terminase Nu1 subunit (DNA packaging protein)
MVKNHRETMSLRYLNISQLAEGFGFDRRTVTNKLADLEPHKIEGKAKLYELRIAAAILLGNESTSSVQMEKQLKEEQLRYEQARADKTVLEVEKLRGEVVHITEVAKAVGSEYARVRSRLLSIPSRCAMDLALESNPSLVKHRLDEDVAEALSELTADETYNEGNDDSQSDETPQEDSAGLSQGASET